MSEELNLEKENIQTSEQAETSRFIAEVIDVVPNRIAPQEEIKTKEKSKVQEDFERLKTMEEEYTFDSGLNTTRFYLYEGAILEGGIEMPKLEVEKPIKMHNRAGFV